MPRENLSIPLNKPNFNTKENIPTTFEKISNTSETSPPLQKQFQPLPEKSQTPRKFSLLRK